MPDAAAAGTPMPGWVESPHLYSPLTGVCGPGKVPVAALMAAPYVPLDLRSSRKGLDYQHDQGRCVYLGLFLMCTVQSCTLVEIIVAGAQLGSISQTVRSCGRGP